MATATKGAKGTATKAKAAGGAKAAGARTRWAAMPAIPANQLLEIDAATRCRIMVDGAWRVCTVRELAKMFESPSGSGAGGAKGAAAAGKSAGRA